MPSEIVDVQTKYGHYTDRLPEEILREGTKEDLEAARLRLLSIMEKDHEVLRTLISKSTKNAYLAKLETSHEYLIKKAFPYGDELESIRACPVNYLLSHWLMAKLSLARISDLILQEFENVRQMDRDFHASEQGSYDRRLAYIKFTRAYQAFRGCAVNILDIMREYVDVLNNVCKELDPSYTFEGGTHVSALHADEIFFGIYEILLRANMGRFSCVPLIRSGLEVLLVRKLLAAPETSRFRGSRLEAVKGFDLMKFLRRHSDKLGISFGLLDVEAIDRIYDWGSVAHHRGYRMAHCEMWYATNIAENVLGLMSIDKAKFDSHFDEVIGELVTKKEVVVL